MIKDIANDVESMIQFTADVPSSYSDKKVPMLDTKVWLNNEDNNKIYYEFYEKPTKSCFVITKQSAMSTRKKIEI